MNDKPGWEAQYQIDTLRADLAKAQAELEPLKSRVEEAYRERDRHIEAASAARLECARTQEQNEQLSAHLATCKELGMSIESRGGTTTALSNVRAIAAEEALAKAQARCAELEVVLTKFMRMGRDDGPTGPECRQAADRALASDGTSALAACRLAQRLVRHCAEPGLVGFAEWRALVKETQEALAEAFGSGE